jgi:hypothetical protein
VKIKTDDRIRRGSAIAYRDGHVAWYGPLDRFPPRDRDKSYDAVHVHSEDLAEADRRTAA